MAKKLKRPVTTDLFKTGYTYSIDTKGKGNVYTKHDFKTLEQNLNETINVLKERTIQLSPEEMKYSKQTSEYAKLLKGVSKEELTNCILSTRQIRNTAHPMKQDPVQKHVIARVLSRRKLLKKLNVKKIEPLVVNGIVKNNVNYQVNLLEDYIFKLTKNLPNEYYNKINTILFVFDSYPGFKEKFLNGSINIYQLALFEKSLLKVYPVKVQNRKAVVQKLIQELYIGTYDVQRFRKSEILTKNIIFHRVKSIERFILDLSDNEKEYRVKIQRLLEYIKTNPKDIFLRSNKDLVGLFRTGIEMNIQTTLDYSHFSYKEITSLILEEQYKLQDLEHQRRLLQSKNKSEVSITKNIKETEETIEVLHRSRRKVQTEQMEMYRKRYLSMLQKKFKPPPPPPKTERKYPPLDPLIVGECVQSFKRTYKTNLNLSLYDMNELNNKMTVMYSGKKHRVIPLETYTSIKDYLIREIEKTETSFFIQNKKLQFKALSQVSNAAGIPLELTTFDNSVKELTKNLKVFHGEVLRDLHEENIFEKLFYVANPFDFYDPTVYRDYALLVKKYTPTKEVIYTKPRAQFEGTWYDVEYLDKDWGTGQPLNAYKQELQKNPKMGTFEVVNKITVRRGKFPFILRRIRTAQEGKYLDVWSEVQPGQVKYKIR